MKKKKDSLATFESAPIGQAAVGMTGLLWAHPVADILSCLLVIILYRITIRRMSRQNAER